MEHSSSTTFQIRIELVATILGSRSWFLQLSLALIGTFFPSKWFPVTSFTSTLNSELRGTCHRMDWAIVWLVACPHPDAASGRRPNRSGALRPPLGDGMPAAASYRSNSVVHKDVPSLEGTCQPATSGCSTTQGRTPSDYLSRILREEGPLAHRGGRTDLSAFQKIKKGRVGHCRKSLKQQRCCDRARLRPGLGTK